jgi:K+-transporting ATPase KdpF subunit
MRRVCGGSDDAAHGRRVSTAWDFDVLDPDRADLRDRPHMNLPLAAFIGHLSGADFFGLVVSVLVCIYLLYALLRGEKF